MGLQGAKCFDEMFSLFNNILKCNRPKDGQTDRRLRRRNVIQAMRIMT